MSLKPHRLPCYLKKDGAQQLRTVIDGRKQNDTWRRCHDFPSTKRKSTLMLPEANTRSRYVQ